MLMGNEYNTKKDYVVMQTESTETHIFTVNTPEQAVELAGQLAQQGFGAILFIRSLVLCRKLKLYKLPDKDLVRLRRWIIMRENLVKQKYQA